MPTIEVSKKDLENLVGKKFSQKELEDAMLYVKGEIDKPNGDAIVVDVKETNRPDLWSTEGIARELRARLGIEKGLTKYTVKNGTTTCTIEKSVEKVRPFIACAVVKNVKVTKEFLRQIIQLQEKVGTTFGRKRKETGIGLYDFQKMTMPVFYKGYTDNEIEFTPLDSKVKMKPSEIIATHPKGKEFGHLLKDTKVYPIIIDSKKIVASMPPIINSEATGRVTENTKEIFIEVTGYNWEICNIALNVIVMAFADRDGKIESVKINFPKGQTYPKKSVYTPSFGTKSIQIEINYIKKILGIELTTKQILDLLSKARYSAKIKGNKIIAEYPSYRNDILHPIDVIEDILISYGYNNFRTQKTELPVTGKLLKKTSLIENTREICVGLGLQEILTFTMTSKEKQEKKLGLKDQEFVEIENPMSSNYAIFRKNLFPELLEFLSKNKNALYPQKIFEIGKTLELNASTQTGVQEKERVAIVISDKKANFTTAKSIFENICQNLGLEFEIKESNLIYLEKGKSAIAVGKEKKALFGELSEKTMQEFKIEEKTIIIELDLE